MYDPVLRPPQVLLRFGIMLILLLLPLAQPLAPANAAPGDLDSSFGTGGRVITDLGNVSEEEGHAVVLQSDGKLVVAGFTGGDFVLVRYTSTGALDTTFSGDGKVTLDFGGVDEAFALAQQTDGKLVAVGESDGAFAVARFNADGSEDATFSGDGKVTTNLSNATEHAAAVALQPDGRIVIAGFAHYVDATSNAEFALVRYTSTGALDATFDGEGVVVTDFALSADVANTLAIQPDGKLVVAGNSASPAGREVALARYNPDGSLDLTFDGDGKVTTSIPGGAGNAQDLKLQPDGKLVIVGIANNADFLLARYTSAGALDTTFGANGFTITDLTGARDYAFALAVQADGKLVAAGQMLFNNFWDIALVRYTNAGVLDPAFGSGGVVRTDFTGQDDFAYGLVQQPDGRIVVSGMSRLGTNDNLALARYGGQVFEITKLVDDPTPDTGRVITYTVVVKNVDVVAVTNAFISDALPSEVSLAGPIVLDPPGAGTVGAPPAVVTNLTLGVGQIVTVTIPVTVTGWPAVGAVVINTASVTSTAFTTPVTASVPITVPAPPVPLDDFVLTAVNTPVTITVLSNDSDPNGDALAVIATGTPLSGTATTDGAIVVYTPPPTFLGTDTFTYTVSDGALSAEGNVTVLVVEEVFNLFLPNFRR